MPPPIPTFTDPADHTPDQRAHAVAAILAAGPGLDGLIAQAEQHLDELNTRRDVRKRELELERHCTIADITHIGRATVLPHPERSSPQLAPMVRDDEIERIAVAEAIRYEKARGWVVESVESENRGFDLISRRPHPEDAKTFVEARFIEVKGRAGVGVVSLTENEYRTAQRLKTDYWLYAVFNCAGKPELHTIPDPARLGWKPVLTVEHYQIAPGDPPRDPTDPDHQNVLRFALLDFIADFANWDNSTVPAYLETARALTQAAHEALGGEKGPRPLVADPFAGGGSIPLEALRVGAGAFASDLTGCTRR
jgi:hypothetical protein